MEEGYDYAKLKEAGRAAHEALEYARKVVKEGMTLLEIAEILENQITGKGFELAFPVNLSINENAAHYTPHASDSTRISGKDVIKVDLGARKDEYLSDCAITIDIGNSHSKMVDASEEALESAISMVRAGRQVNEIGREIGAIAEKHGFRPIRNLGGHGVGREDLHADIFIPNFDNGDTTRLEEGQVIAIEPFITDGEGIVRDGELLQIFQKTMDAAPRQNELRAVSEFIDSRYRTYPFALRWLQKEFPKLGEFGIRRALNDLASRRALESFPVLVERKGGMVAQAEKEVIVEKDGCYIVTK